MKAILLSTSMSHKAFSDFSDSLRIAVGLSSQPLEQVLESVKTGQAFDNLWRIENLYLVRNNLSIGGAVVVEWCVNSIVAFEHASRQ